VDATIIHAPSSTKNASGERDPEMRQTRKGNQWYFGLKAHIGVDAKQGTVHTLVTTSANVADSTVLPNCCTARSAKCGRRRLSGTDRGDPTSRSQGSGHDLPQDKFKNYVDELQKKKNRNKSSVRAKVEHPFRILKRVFGFDKVRYRGLAKNHHRLCANFALVNLYLHRKHLAVLG